MAKTGGTSWLVVEELFERGEPGFVDELRRCSDAERLAGFAVRWYADPRIVARRFLCDYLSRPLNAFRHEPLVKRLFKLAEKAEDDATMARFLVLFDRSIRRVKRKSRSHLHETLNRRDAAQALLQKWSAEGATYTNVYEWRNQFHASETLRCPPSTAMPRGTIKESYRDPRTGRTATATDVQALLGLSEFPTGDLKNLPDRLRKRIERLRLFSVHTRYYLRRRAWRYFRRLGKQQPEGYVAAVSEALKLYDDADASDGLALLDNWGLMHILFHHSPVLVAQPHGWTMAPDRALSELKPAPCFASLWKAAPRALVDILKNARCRAVRSWAIQVIRAEPARILAQCPLEELLALLGHEDDEVAALAAEGLQHVTGLDRLPVERWLSLLDTPNVSALETLCQLVTAHVKPEMVTLAQAVRVAISRPFPVARLGLEWLRSKSPVTSDECRALFGLAEAQAESVRPQLVRWVRSALSASPSFQPVWVLEFLDSRHADVRGEGWLWFQEDARLCDHVELWRKLLESPYDDVRLKLIAALEQRAAARKSLEDESALDAELLRFLWASVLLNIHRGGRSKPLVVAQLVRRLERRPDEAERLLPILRVALRSVRGPEWRAGLAGIVRLAERQPALADDIRASVPELNLLAPAS